MNVTPVQNNNSQSFGMSLRLKGDGAKNLATALDAASYKYASRFENDVLGKIHASKTDVIYDGENVIIKANSEDVFGNSWNSEELTDLVVSDKIPVAAPNSNSKILQYITKDGNDELVFKVRYDKPQGLADVCIYSALMQKLFNAKEILKVLDAKAADRVYKAEQVAAKQARIDARAKRLEELYS